MSEFCRIVFIFQRSVCRRLCLQQTQTADRWGWKCGGMPHAIIAQLTHTSLEPCFMLALNKLASGNALPRIQHVPQGQMAAIQHDIEPKQSQ